MTDGPIDRHVAIVGAGISGMAMAMRLQGDGTSFTIFEKADRPGGTWRDNRYPGLTCDVPAAVYTFRNHRRIDWPTLLAEGPDLEAYLLDVFEKAGLRDHTRFGAAVESAAWTDGAWTVRASDGFEGRFDAIVHATGFLHHPTVPDLTGLDDFAGPAFHSARWPDDLDPAALEGRTVGVIGTGSTGVQLTTALSVHSDVRLFQRTPQWIFPFPNLRIPRIVARALGARPALLDRIIEGAEAAGDWFIGGAARGNRLPRAMFVAGCRVNLARVRDRALRARLRPTQAPMCKRPVMSSGFYRAVQRDSVEVVDAGIDRIVADGVRTVDGRHHRCDVLVLATGFDAHAYMRPMAVTGVDGVDLADAWSGGPRAYRTIALHGFPNMFLMFGPHAPLLSVAIHNTAEREADYIASLLARGAADGVALHPSAAAADGWADEMRAELSDSVWVGDCNSWYLDESGSPIMWPGTRDDWFELLAEPTWDDFAAVPARTKV